MNQFAFCPYCDSGKFIYKQQSSDLNLVFVFRQQLLLSASWFQLKASDFYFKSITRVLSQVCWPIFSSLPHPAAVLRSHTADTSLMLVSNWHCGVSLQSHLWLGKTKMGNLSSGYLCGYCIFCCDVVCTAYPPPAKSQETICCPIDFTLHFFTI